MKSMIGVQLKVKKGRCISFLSIDVRKYEPTYLDCSHSLQNQGYQLQSTEPWADQSCYSGDSLRSKSGIRKSQSEPLSTHLDVESSFLQIRLQYLYLGHFIHLLRKTRLLALNFREGDSIEITMDLPLTIVPGRANLSSKESIYQGSLAKSRFANDHDGKVGAILIDDLMPLRGR